MARTRRFSLSKFGSLLGGAITDDASKFSARDPDTIDALFSAYETHSHSGKARLADPSGGPTLALFNTGGSFPVGARIYYRASYLDEHGLETAASPEVSVQIQTGNIIPGGPLVQAIAGGTLPFGTYGYALTASNTDASGETPPGPVSLITIDNSSTPYAQSVQIIPPQQNINDASAITYQVYRQAPGSTAYLRIGTIPKGSVGGLTDTGLPALTGTPPNLTATTVPNSVQVTVPDPERAFSGWRLYSTFVPGVYSGQNLVAEVRETVNPDGTGGIVTSWIDTGGNRLYGMPLDSSQTVGSPPAVLASAIVGSAQPDASQYGNGMLWVDTDTNPPTVSVLENGQWLSTGPSAPSKTGLDIYVGNATQPQTFTATAIVQRAATLGRVKYVGSAVGAEFNLRRNGTVIYSSGTVATTVKTDAFTNPIALAEDDRLQVEITATADGDLSISLDIN